MTRVMSVEDSLIESDSSRSSWLTIVAGLVLVCAEWFHTRTYSRGKLPRSGGVGLYEICPPPGPPKLISTRSESESESGNSTMIVHIMMVRFRFSSTEYIRTDSLVWLYSIIGSRFSS